MKRLFFILSLFLSSATMWAEDISIPTDADHHFDLTLGEVISDKQRQHFTQNGVENMYDGDQLVYTIDNRDNAEFYNFYLEATKNSGTQTIDLSLTNEGGEAVADTTFAIDQSGHYAMRMPTMKKGRYTLTLTFHQLSNKSWSSATLNGLAFRMPQSLKPGDQVDIQNPEFDDSFNGWTRTGGNGNGISAIGGNSSGRVHFSSGTGLLSQTVYNLPDGIYLLRLCAYDGANNLVGTDAVEQDTYVFLNERAVPMKTAFDETISYRNIYRWYDGKTNDNYRHTTDGRFVPTQQVEWNEALAMTEHFYENCIVTVITSGQATFGWRKTGNRSTHIAFDHASLTYLSDKTTLSGPERTALETQQVTDDYKARLNTLLNDIKTQLNNGKPHAPQAIAEANRLLAADNHGLARTDSFLAADLHGLARTEQEGRNSPSQSDAKLIDAILHAEHTAARLALPYYEATVPDASPSGLADQLAALAIQPTDTIALKLNGTLTDDDLATLKTLSNVMELDLSAITNTTLPKEQFNNKKLLTWVTLPQHLETIDDKTFYDCYSLRDMQLPTTLRNIGSRPFYNCISLDRAVIPENVTVSSEAYYGTGIRSIVLPRSMREVPTGLCNKCKDLIDIQFNGQVTIGQDAFANCTALIQLTIPEGVQWLDDGCFWTCTGLTSVNLPSTLVTVSRPFHNCRNLTELTCLTVAPPYAQNRSLHGDITSKGFTLRVPQWSVAAYQEANKWSEFNIEALDVLPPTITVNSPLTIDASNSQPADYKPDVNLSLLTFFWGGNVSSIATRGALTVDGSQMFSAGRLTQLYNFFACRSQWNRSDEGYTDYFASLINQGQMRADQVTAELRFWPEKWEYISFPFDARVGDIEVFVDGVKQPLSEIPFVIYGYDCAKRAEGRLDEAWVRMTADSTLHAGHGYIWQTKLGEEMTSKGTPHSQFLVNAAQNATKPLFFRNANVEVKLDRHYSEFAHNRSWNFIGNPYPSFFDIRYMDTTAPIIVQTYTGSGGRYTAYSPLDDYYALHPGQAFFIQRPLDQETVIFDREGRQHSVAQRDYIPAGTRASKVQATETRHVYNLLLKAPLSTPQQSNEAPSGAVGGALDRTRFVINEAASLAYEPGRDAPKFDSPDAANLYTVRDGVRYAIDERPLSDATIRLGLKTTAPGTYTLALAAVPADSPVAPIILIDRETGTETDLTATPYTFQAEADTTEARFLVRLNTAVTTVTCVANSQQNAPLFDLQGRPVTTPRPGIYLRNNKKVIIK